MKQGVITLFVGLLFGLGLTVSGMTQPQKVISFLDVFGDWDPSLAFVMVGAIGVHVFAYQIRKKRRSPFLAESFLVPDNKKLDKKLIIGSALFGVGWAIGGYCPGPAITSLVSMQNDALIFVGSMTAGMFIHKFSIKKRS